MTNITVIPLRRQKVWSWPAVALFTLGGMGAGLYLSSLIVTLAVGGMDLFKQGPLPFGLVSCLIIVSGFLIILGELAKPLKSYYAIYGLNNSWLSREMLSFFVLFSSVLIDNTSSSVFFRVVSVGAATLFIYSQGSVVYGSRAISAWNVKIIPFLFVLSGTLSGYGVFLLLFRIPDQAMAAILALVGITLLTANILALIIYLVTGHSSEFLRATKELKTTKSVFFNILLAGVVPLTLLLILVHLAKSGNEGVTQIGNIAVAVGLIIILGAISQKTSIIRIASFIRGVSIEISETWESTKQD